MATNPTAVVHQGMVRIPSEFASDPRFHEGAAVELVPVDVAERDDDLKARWDDFFKLRGMLAHSGFDPNAELEAEKQRELVDEAHW